MYGPLLKSNYNNTMEFLPLYGQKFHGDVDHFIDTFHKMASPVEQQISQKIITLLFYQVEP